MEQERPALQSSGGQSGERLWWLAPWRLTTWTWERQPFAAAAFVLIFDFGILLALRSLQDGHIFLDWGNKTFTLGDSIFLPAYAALGGLALRRTATPVHTSRAWNIAVFLTGIAGVVALDLVTLGDGDASVVTSFDPPRIYHAIVFPLVFWLLVGPLPQVWRARATRPGTLAIVALAAYVAISVVELRLSTVRSLIQMANGIEAVI